LYCRNGFFISAIAQQETVFITGTITEKVNAELVIFKKVNSKSQKLGDYKIDPANTDFVFAIPFDPAAVYSFHVILMKQGHMRLEADKRLIFPLQVKAGNNYSLKITPSKLDTGKKTGWVLKNGAGKPSAALVTGKLVNWKYNTEVSLQKITDGKPERVNSFTTGADGKFILTNPVKQEGFYNLTTGRWRIRIYLKPSDKLDLSIDGKVGIYSLNNGSEENKLLQKWQQLILPVTGYGFNEVSFRADSIDLKSYCNDYEKLEPEMIDFINANSISNPQFNKLFKLAMDVDRELAPMFLLYNLSVKKVRGFRPTPKNFNEVPAFYQRFIQPGKFDDASILAICEARQYMNLYAKLNIGLLPEDQRVGLLPGEKLGRMINTITNDTLKSFFLMDQMGEIEVNNLSEFKATFEPYKKYANQGNVNQAYQGVYNLFIGDTAYIGKSAYNFSLPDTSGRMVSMKDFKGKVIFIDVWATWCGPCRGQFPFMKEIEEEYKNNKDIVFMGISLDRVRDRQKWLKFIRKENLHGVQLLDDFGNAFGQPYQINAIPRFLLIGKDGKWIEIRCPLPEKKGELKKYLDNALAGV
jgi:thiol-disulfide isomerase/thioredoxin